MSEHKTLCMGCMEESDSFEICPKCGYVNSSANPASYLQPRTVLDSRYVVGRLLRYNGESAVYIGYDNLERTKVFIKEYMPDAICRRSSDGLGILVNQNSLVQYKNYMSEFVELNKGLTRFRTMSHIIAPNDMFSANGTAYVVMGYCDGVTLKQYLADNAGELSWEQVKKLFPPLLTTLGCLHNAGIIHRGISLDNILVTDRVELRLTGFSIPEIRTVNTDLAPELYPGYSAPEQYGAADWDGTWTDVYSIAAVMYRILTGCMPNEAMARVGNDSLLEPGKINSHIPANVSRVIAQAMALSCQRRIQTITDFVTKLFEQPSYMSKLPNGSTQTINIDAQRANKKPKPASKGSKRGANPGMFIAAGLLLAVVVTAFVLLILMLLPDGSGSRNNPAVTPSTGSDSTPGVSEAVPDVPSIVTLPTEDSEPVTTPSAPTGTMFVMPDLKGEKYTSVIESETWKERLEFDAVYEYSDDYESGLIFDQDIPAGTDLYPVQKVRLFVSKGLRIVEIPDYMYQDEFTGMEFRYTKEEYVEILDGLNIKYTLRELNTPYEQSGFVMGVYCKQTGDGVGGQINVEEGDTLYVDISVYTPDAMFAG